MKINSVLLSQDNYYLAYSGKLPKRPSFDKQLITKLALDRTVLCSENTLKGIPPSIRNAAAEITTDPNKDWHVNFGIKTFSELADIFIISRSSEDLCEGSPFDMLRIKDNYMPMYIGKELELWILDYGKLSSQ